MHISHLDTNITFKLASVNCLPLTYTVSKWADKIHLFCHIWNLYWHVELSTWRALPNEMTNWKWYEFRVFKTNYLCDAVYRVSEIGCLMSHATIFQLYMWRHVDVQADWKRSLTYDRASNAIDIS